MSLTVRTECYRNDVLDIYTLVESGELTVSITEGLLHLDYEIGKHGIESVSEGTLVPDELPAGSLFLNQTNGNLLFWGASGVVLVGRVEKRDGINVISRVSELPDTPDEGDQYIIRGSAQGDLREKRNYIAKYSNNRWYFTVPTEGQQCGVLEESSDFVFNGYAWIKVNTAWVEAIPPE